MTDAARDDDAWMCTADAARYIAMTVAALRKAVQRGRIVPDSPATPGWTRDHRFKRSTLDEVLRMRGQRGQAR